MHGTCSPSPRTSSQQTQAWFTHGTKFRDFFDPMVGAVSQIQLSGCWIAYCTFHFCMRWTVFENHANNRTSIDCLYLYTLLRLAIWLSKCASSWRTQSQDTDPVSFRFRWNQESVHEKAGEKAGAGEKGGEEASSDSQGIPRNMVMGR